MNINVVFSNKSSPLNKKLIKFFEVNLASLNNASIVFKFEVAHPNEIDIYIKRGIKNYPILLHKKTSVTGVEKIIQYLKLIVKKHNTKILSKTDNDRLDDFWKDTIGKIEHDESGNIKPDTGDEDGGGELGGGGDNLHHKIQEAFEQRNSGDTQLGSIKSSQHTRNKPMTPRNNNLKELTPAQTMKKMSKQGSNNMDDILMAKFFENKEESM
jgi:hypothetical protein